MLKTWKQLRKIETENQSDEESSTSAQENVPRNDSDMDEMEVLMKTLEQEKKKEATSSSIINIKDRLNSFFQLPRLKSKENILNFWHKKKHSMPDLYKLANIVLAVPFARKLVLKNYFHR